MSEVRIVPLAEFVGVEEASSEPLLGVRGESLLPAGGRLLMFGDAGSGKTTLTVDAVAHFGAGMAWLGIEVARPLRVLVIENEGPRGPFREKLGAKVLDWPGPPFRESVFVLTDPWAGFSFADPQCTDAVLGFIAQEGIDVLVAGPLASLGVEGVGSPVDVQAFAGRLAAMKAQAAKPYAEWLVHHEAKDGRVSGAWGRVPDTLLHVQGRGNGHTHVRIEKARHSSRWHDSSLVLAWAEGKGFAVEDRAPVSDDTMADDLFAAVRDQPGGSWTKLRPQVRGGNTDTARVRDRLLADGLIVNTATRDGHFNLWAADDTALPRSEPRTGLERPTFPHGAGDAETTRSTVPPYRGTGTGTERPDTVETETA